MVVTKNNLWIYDLGEVDVNYSQIYSVNSQRWDVDNSYNVQKSAILCSGEKEIDNT